MKKKVGKVTDEEKNEILLLFERKNGLSELVKLLTSEQKDLYDMVVKDLGETSMKFQNWWKDNSEKYGWEAREDGNWEIDFQTGDIYLI